MDISLGQKAQEIREKCVENLQELCVDTRESISNACMDTEESWEEIIQVSQACQQLEESILNINAMFDIDEGSDPTPKPSSRHKSTRGSAKKLDDKNAYRPNGKLRPGYATPASKFTQLVLNAVKDEGGTTTREKVLEKIERQLGPKFNKYDFRI